MASGINRENKPDTGRSEQAVLNKGFDEEFGVIAVEQLGYAGSALHRQRADDAVVLYDPAGYLGFAEPGSLSSAAVWQIKHLDTSSGLVTTFADGNADYDNVWDNRAILAYS